MTNTVVLESGVFKNADGLRVKYGLAETRKGVAGTVAAKDDERFIYVDIDWTRLPAHAGASTTGNIYGSEPECSVPTGAIITAASLEVTTAFSTGSSPTLTLGLVDSTGQDTGGGSHNGFFSAITTGAQGSVTASSGALLNAAPTTAPLYVWAAVGTADYTAGAARLKITYNMPRSV